MKKILALVMAVFVLALVGCNEEKVDPGTKIAVVDPGKAIMECDSGKAGMEYLQKLGADMEAYLKPMQEASQADPSQENTGKFHTAVNDMQIRMGAEQQRIVGMLQENYDAALDAYRSENGVGLILVKEGVQSYDPALEITDAIIAALNTKKVDIEPEVSVIDQMKQDAIQAKDEAADEGGAEAAPEGEAQAQ